ncbi:helix-turn-helix domain-containing protein [bacterium]|nr:MAG: helix-turn-helix domain-containing protein [bacterium]
MAQFYKELKDLRISKEISLEDLESKTKINVKYLNAIEQGDFDILPTPYLRLFIKAYAVEIGGDAKRALEQLDSFVGNNRPTATTSQIKNIDKEENKTDDYFSFLNLFSDSNLKLRNDILKVSLLSILFIFSIIIIKNISSETESINTDSSQSAYKNQIKVIDDEELLLNYAEDKFIEKSLNTEPPFFLSINANSELSMLIEQDTIDTYTELLYPGTEINLQGFVSKAKIIFSNTDKIKARLNGEELSIIENYPHPLKLIIQSSPPSISIRLFTPLN